MPRSPLRTCRPRLCQLRNPATRVACGACAPISSRLPRNCGELHRVHDSGSLHLLLRRGFPLSRPTAHAQRSI